MTGATVGAGVTGDKTGAGVTGATVGAGLTGATVASTSVGAGVTGALVGPIGIRIGDAVVGIADVGAGVSALVGAGVMGVNVIVAGAADSIGAAVESGAIDAMGASDATGDTSDKDGDSLVSGVFTIGAPVVLGAVGTTGIAEEGAFVAKPMVVGSADGGGVGDREIFGRLGAGSKALPPPIVALLSFSVLPSSLLRTTPKVMATAETTSSSTAPNMSVRRRRPTVPVVEEVEKV